MKIKNFFSKLNIKIAMAFLLLNLFAIAVFSFFTFRLTFDLLKKEDTLKTETSIAKASDFIASYINKLKSFSEIIAWHPDVYQALVMGESASLDSIHSLILLAKNSDSRIKSISVVSRNGLVITSGNGMSVPISGDMLNEDWYRSALNSSSMPVLASTGHGIFEMDENDWIVSICKEIKNDDNEHLGLVIIDVSYTFIEDYISGPDLGENGYIYIVSEDQTLIYHPDKSLLSKFKTSKLPFSDDEFVYSTKIDSTDWTMYGKSSFDNLKLLQARFTKIILFSTALCIGLSILLGFVLSHFLSRPIVSLTGSMMQADRTWSHIPMEKSGSVEVETLKKEYNNLIDRIKKLTENIARKEEDRRRFELKALQSQINPHFLYNTLDTILWLAELEMNREVVEVSSSLGKMLRISLSNEQAFVTLKTELQHVASYLNIQKIRYDDLLNYQVSGEEELLDLYVPKLIIQPIAENSIYHGIRGKTEKGNIAIRYYRSEDMLIIRVEDDGVGFDTGLPDNKEKKINVSGGIGMNNVHSRIRILCGDDYGLEIHSSPNKGTIVSIRLPIKRESDFP